MSPDTASGTPLSAVPTLPPDEKVSAERWRQWQIGNVEVDRRDSKRMRFVFAALFAALGMWLGIQLLAPSLVP